VCLCVLGVAESADGYSLPIYVPEHVQNEISENRLYLAGNLSGLVRQSRKDVVVVDAVFKLLHETDDLALNALSRFKAPVRNHEHVNIAILRSASLKPNGNILEGHLVAPGLPAAGAWYVEGIDGVG
jgi:hypothetical protein